MYLIFVRHGDPIYNPDSITEKGKLQAQALSHRMARLGLDKIYSSTSNRAIMTAEPTAKLLGKEIELLDFANEKYASADFGVDSDGKWVWCFFDKNIYDKFSTEEVANMGFGWYESELFKDRDFGKGINRVRTETVRLIESFGYEYDYQKRSYKSINHKYNRVALFAHGGFGMAFLSCLLEIPYPVFCTRFTQLNCTGVCVIEIADEGDKIIPKLYQYANDSHLYKEELPLDFNGREIY